MLGHLKFGAVGTPVAPGTFLVGHGSVRPDLLSITFTRRATAQEFYDEATANGERVCLQDLDAASAGPQGQRFWLHSC
jgi:hypothetical protein